MAINGYFFVIASFVVVFLSWNYLTSSQLGVISSEPSQLMDNLKLIFSNPGQVISVIFSYITYTIGKFYQEWAGVSGYDYWFMPGFI